MKIIPIIGYTIAAMIMCMLIAMTYNQKIQVRAETKKLNSMQLALEKVADKGLIDNDVITDLKYDLTTTGGTYKIYFTAERLILNPDTNTFEYTTIYTNNGEPFAKGKQLVLNKGDIVTLKVEKTGSDIFTKYITHLAGSRENNSSVTLAKSVRNNGGI